MPREKVLACATRLLDRGFFRIGVEDYAEENDTYGLATMHKRHVTVDGDEVTLRLRGQGRRAPRPGRSATRRWRRSSSELKRRRGGGEELLAYKDGRRWVDVKSADINAYVKQVTGGDFSAKDFRTWSGTVLAAVALAVSGMAADLEDRAQAGQVARRQGGRALPRQHAGRLPRLVHRPARVRPLRRRPHDQRRAARADGGHRPPGRTCSRRSRRPCSTCSRTTARRTASSACGSCARTSPRSRPELFPHPGRRERNNA